MLYKAIFSIILFAWFSNSSNAMEQYIDISNKISGERIVEALQRFGRYDLEEYRRETDFNVDSTIEHLFSLASKPLPGHSLLLEQARMHPRLCIAPQPDLRKAGQADALGLFTSEAITKGSAIIEYVGQVKVIFTLVEEEPKLISWLPSYLSSLDMKPSGYTFGFQGKNLSPELMLRAKSLATSSSDMIMVDVCVDPAKRGNAGRFANHSAKWANAKMTVAIEHVDGKAYFHPLLVALRNIEPGEEILWDYGMGEGQIEIKGKQLSPDFQLEAQINFISAVNSPQAVSDNDQCLKRLQDARFFYDNLTQREAQAMLVKPSNYLLRREGSDVFFCVLAQREELDASDQLIIDLEYIEMKLWIIDGQFTFDPESNPNGFYNYFTQLGALKRIAKYSLPDHLVMSKARPIRKN